MLVDRAAAAVGEGDLGEAVCARGVKLDYHCLDMVDFALERSFDLAATLLDSTSSYSPTTTSTRTSPPWPVV